jgi:hypothetical protein
MVQRSSNHSKFGPDRKFKQIWRSRPGPISVRTRMMGSVRRKIKLMQIELFRAYIFQQKTKFEEARLPPDLFQAFLKRYDVETEVLFNAEMLSEFCGLVEKDASNTITEYLNSRAISMDPSLASPKQTKPTMSRRSPNSPGDNRTDFLEFESFDTKLEFKFLPKLNHQNVVSTPAAYSKKMFVGITKLLHMLLKVKKSKECPKGEMKMIMKLWCNGTTGCLKFIQFKDWRLEMEVKNRLSGQFTKIRVMVFDFLFEFFILELPTDFPPKVLMQGLLKPNFDELDEAYQVDFPPKRLHGTDCDR